MQSVKDIFLLRAEDTKSKIQSFQSISLPPSCSCVVQVPMRRTSLKSAKGLSLPSSTEIIHAEFSLVELVLGHWGMHELQTRIQFNVFFKCIFTVKIDFVILLAFPVFA